MKYIFKSANETSDFGMCISQGLSGGDIVLLYGDLGTGKTIFTKGIAKGLCIQAPVVSPTFTIMKEYSGRLNLYHFDIYRLKNAEEIENTGLNEFLGKKDGVCVIEWADRLPDDYFPQKTIKVKFKYLGNNTREIEILNKDKL